MQVELLKLMILTVFLIHHILLDGIKKSRNLLYIQQIINVVQTELAQFFIKEWNSRYKLTHGEWDDTIKSGKKFCTLESGRKLDKTLKLKYQDGDTSKWDCTTLFDAILFSKSISRHLDKKTKDAVHALRGERNKDAHWYESEYSDDDFDKIVNIIEKSFQDLKFSLDEINKIKNHRNSFNSFQVFPSKPKHFLVERIELRDKIINDLKKLRNDNNNELTMKIFPPKKVKNLRSLVSARLKFWQNWLIIVDNVVQLSEISSLLPQVGDHMWKNGQLIITVQNTDAVPYDELSSKHISISKGLNDRECCQLLNSYTKDENADDQLLNEVSHALDRQPLSLAATGYYVSRVNKANCSFTWKEYLKKISLEEEENMSATFVKFNSVYPRSMLQASLLAVKQSAEESSILALVISFFSMISFDPLPRDIMVYYVQQNDPKQAEEDICLCLDECSLFLHSENNDISLHRIVHKAIIDYQSEHSNEEHEMEANVDQISEALYMFKERDDEIKLMPHGNVFYETGNYDKAIEFHEKALEIQKQSLGPNHVDVAGSLNNLGNVYKDTGNYDKAIEFHEKALEIRKQSLGPNHVDVATSLNNLGSVYRGTGNYDKAIEFHEKALEIRKQSLGPNHVDVAASLNNLGIVYIITGNYDKSIEYYEKALEIQKQSLGPNHVDVARSLNNL
ncbi:uncharacterized protein LOC124448023, partial [Xenia sp. Carnegie-2017]|uniref:uncharacterized protein LOC124448023 n=1 Tax=Xenia sp. Carnegie-2017 TaxID=2897299 RepID=UPI001F04078A